MKIKTHQNCCNSFVVVDAEASGAQSIGPLKGNTNWAEFYQLGYRLGLLRRSPRDYSFVKKICKEEKRNLLIMIVLKVNVVKYKSTKLILSNARKIFVVCGKCQRVNSYTLKNDKAANKTT
jgi:hypothetical protein